MSSLSDRSNNVYVVPPQIVGSTTDSANVFTLYRVLSSAIFCDPLHVSFVKNHPNSLLCRFSCRILLNRFAFYLHHSIHVAMAQIKEEKMDMSMNGPNNGNHKPKEEFHGGGRGGRGNRFQPYSGPNRDRKGPRDNNMVILLRFLSSMPSSILLTVLTIGMRY